MQKVMKYSKRILSVVLALVLTLAYLPMFNIETEAATTTYSYRVTGYVGGTGNATETYIRVYFKTANGEGSAVSEYADMGIGKKFWGKDTSDRTFNKTAPSAGYFPYKVEVYIKSTTGSIDDAYAKLEVLNSSGVAVASCQTEAISTYWSNKTRSAEISAESYPYPTSLSVSDTSEVVIPKSGSTSRAVTLTAYDQYGVEWVNAPSSLSGNNGETFSSKTIKTPTITFYDYQNDYQSNINATYSTANSSHNPATVTNSATSV